MMMCQFGLEPKPRNALKLTVFTRVMREKHIKVCSFVSIIVLDQLAYNDLDLLDINNMDNVFHEIDGDSDKINTLVKSKGFKLSMEDVPKLKPRPSDEDSVRDQENQLQDAFENLLDNIGEDKNRQGLLKTPARAAKAMLFFTKGYEETISGE